jgi:pentatricopeptide repeat protein
MAFMTSVIMMGMGVGGSTLGAFSFVKRMKRRGLVLRAF